MFCVNVESCAVKSQLRHNLIALKYASKIRDAIIRKQNKRLNKDLSLAKFDQYNQSIIDVNNELIQLRQMVE